MKRDRNKARSEALARYVESGGFDTGGFSGGLWSYDNGGGNGGSGFHSGGGLDVGGGYKILYLDIFLN